MRAAGRGAGNGAPPSRGNARSYSALPTQTNKIMDAFLLNNKHPANKYEQNQQQESQSAILSRLRRQQQSAPGTTNSRPSAAAAAPQQQKQPLQQEVQPLVDPRPPPPSNQLSRATNDISNIQNDKYASSWNAMESQLKLNSLQPQHQQDQTHHPYNLQYRGEQLRHRPNIPQGQGSIKLEIDEENDIVCCDGEPCHEGTKNLCTIALWALIVFGIMNRFFVHMAMHLHKADGSVSLKEHDASFNTLQDNSMQDVHDHGMETGGTGVYMVGQE